VYESRNSGGNISAWCKRYVFLLFVPVVQLENSAAQLESFRKMAADFQVRVVAGQECSSPASMWTVLLPHSVAQLVKCVGTLLHMCVVLGLTPCRRSS
jgi:hypothetical protein